MKPFTRRVSADGCLSYAKFTPQLCRRCLLCKTWWRLKCRFHSNVKLPD